MAGEELGLAEAIDAVRPELRGAQSRGRRSVATFERLVVDSAGLPAPHHPDSLNAWRLRVKWKGEGQS
jgi:hypothetical protein